jgi:hypothetical protein
VLEVVEGQQEVGDHEREVRDSKRIGAGRSDGRLGVAGEVVAEEAHRAAGEGRKVEVGRRLVALELACHRGEGVVKGPFLAVHREHAPVEPDDGPRLEAEERPAAEALALLGRLEEEGGAVAAQLEVCGHRRLAVVDERVAKRHDGVLAGQAADLLEPGRDVELERISGDGH